MIEGMLLGAALLFTGGIGGYLLGSRDRRAHTPEQPKPVCITCTHGIGTHKKRTGQCQVEYPNGKICACFHYDGPIPLNPYYAPEIVP